MSTSREVVRQLLPQVISTDYMRSVIPCVHTSVVRLFRASRISMMSSSSLKPSMSANSSDIASLGRDEDRTECSDRRRGSNCGFLRQHSGHGKNHKGQMNSRNESAKKGRADGRTGFLEDIQDRIPFCIRLDVLVGVIIRDTC